jgi:acetyl-CoA carboxylase biotin carboxyl carrier protein
MRIGGRRVPLEPDAKVIRALAVLLSETGLTEIEYAVGDHRIRVARDSAGKGASAANGHTPAPDAAAAEPDTPIEPSPPSDVDHPGTLKSPMVGVAYLAPEPGAAPYARVGDTISKGQTLLIIEAMKVMNQISAPRAGRLVRIFVEDSGPVEYGAPLMLIE